MKRMDDQLMDVFWNVFIRYRAHHQYGSKEKALKALAKRSKRPLTRKMEKLFDNALKIYDEAAELISSGEYIDEGKTKTGYAEFEDVQIEKCLRVLKKKGPAVDEKLMNAILTWVIFWYYLK